MMLEKLAAQPLPIVPGYRVCALLGRGGMGEVYAATDEVDGRFVAVKLLRPDAVTPTSVARFDRERRVLARFDDPHIARLLHHGTTNDGVPYLVVEYVEGQPITDYCESRRLELRARLPIFQEVCRAVAVAHHLGIVHRDLKPANILVSDAGAPKLLDFGIAKLTDQMTEALTATGCRLLTPEYASVEQIRGGAITPASDVYSLGIILAEVASGMRLADGAVTVADSRLRSVVSKATTERAADRYRTAAELADDIQAYLDGKAVKAHSRRPMRASQLAIAVAIVIAVSMSLYLRAEHKPKIPSASERDYLVARYLWNKLSPAELVKAENWFRRAVERDPRSALAHAGLADVFYFRGELGSMPPRRAFTQAKAEAEKAVELDPRLPLGHVVLGAALHAGDLKWSEAERELKTALKLDPSSIRALQGYSCFLMRSGRFAEARKTHRESNPARPGLTDTRRVEGAHLLLHARLRTSHPRTAPGDRARAGLSSGALLSWDCVTGSSAMSPRRKRKCDWRRSVRQRSQARSPGSVLTTACLRWAAACQERRREHAIPVHRGGTGPEGPGVRNACPSAGKQTPGDPQPPRRSPF